MTYHGLHFNENLRYDVTFTVEPERLLMDVMQFCDSDLPVLESEAWRFCWDLTVGMTAAVAEPMPLRGYRHLLPARTAIYGFTEKALNLAGELDAGYAAGFHTGGLGSGVEFRSWDGVPTGYEGTLIGCFGPLYAIATGQLTPTDPAWWPAGG